MKKVFSVILSLVLLSVVALPAFAEGIPHRVASGSGEPGAKKEMVQQKHAGNLKERAQKELTRRINSLNKLIDRINALKKITSDQKTTLVKDVQTEIDSLNALQATISTDSDTDVQKLKTDVQSIVKSYRVFALYIPQINIIVSGDRILTIADEFNSLIDKINKKISENQNNASAEASLQQALADLQTKVADSKTQAQNAIDLVTPLTPDGYPGNKSILQNARADIQKAQKDLLSARQEVNKAISGISGKKGLKNLSPKKESEATSSGENEK